MTKRPHVPRNTHRKLWAEAMGHCMSPECGSSLISSDTNLSECAHIVPHADGGDVSFENLILLCRNCHVQIDREENGTRTKTLRRWKKNRSLEIESRFTQDFKTFHQLRAAVVPMLRRNAQIFDSYGPYSDDPNNAERQQLWARFEGEIVCHNKHLALILDKNKETIASGEPGNCRQVFDTCKRVHKYQERRAYFASESVPV